MNFGSDNQSGISQIVLQAINRANSGSYHGYGNDLFTQRAQSLINSIFEAETDSFFVTTGTAANSLALACLVEPWQTIICHSQSHIAMDESTAPEFFTGGARIITLGKGTGKLTKNQLETYLTETVQDYPHNPIHGAISLTQVNENGLVYSAEEVKSICDLAHNHNLHVHMDGARFANAVTASKCSPAALTWQAGIDVLTLGATKNGCLAAEAVIFFNSKFSQTLQFRRKRTGHLISKSRFLGAQFCAWLENDHWLTLAQQANEKAQILSQLISQTKDCFLAWPTMANEIFAVMSVKKINQLRKAGAEFYDWYPSALPEGTKLKTDQAYIRLVTSHTTTLDEIDAFMRTLEEIE